MRLNMTTALRYIESHLVTLRARDAVSHSLAETNEEFQPS